MIRDITLGQYYPVKSPVHSLDPRTKLLVTLLYIISIFAADHIAGYLLAVLFLAMAIHFSHVPVRHIAKGLKSIVILMLFSISFNLFLTPGETLVKLGFLSITREGLVLASKMAVRLILLVMGSSIMTFTTTPTALTDGIEQGLKGLNRLKVPVHEIAMMMSIALRFIPILTEETDKIMKAQMARGADFETGGIVQRAKALVPVLVPLFISAFRRASDLAMAMEARCYHGGEGRTKMHPLRYQKRDCIAYTITAVYLAALILMKIVL